MIGRRPAIAVGIAATLAAAAAWHGPMGAADRLASDIETTARRTLDYYELPALDARMERGPTTRRIILSGPADDFQRRELVRIMESIPGVSEARWSDSQGRGLAIPLLAEAMVLALIGFALGLLVAYLAELQRRANAEWRW